VVDVPEFQQDVLSGDLEDLFSRTFFGRIPFVFGEDATLFRAWRAQLAVLLDVDACEVTIVGSAAVGFSLSSYKDFQLFHDGSDIDVAVISDRHFSDAWHHLRGIDATLDSLTPAQRSWLNEHRTRLIYWGCIATDKILPILPFAIRWMSARSKMASEAPTEGRQIKFRVYKDFRALRSYHLAGLKELKAKLLG
jgi:hypothetical protein